MITIGIDLGTTHIKAVSIAEQGSILAAANRAIPMILGPSGLAEQEPRTVLQALPEVMRELISQLPGRPIAAIGLSGAMHSLLPVDRSGQPLANASTWADHRSLPQAAAFQTLSDRHEIYLRTGCPLQTTYFPARLRWWRENHPEIWIKVDRWLGMKDYVLFHMTGRSLTDFEIASATGLFDIRALSWSAPALDLAGIDSARLPALAPPATVVGPLLPGVAEQWSLPPGIPVVLGGSDGGMATLASSPVDPDNVTLTVGTSGAVRLITDAPRLDPRERTWCYWLWPERWIAGGAINNGGLAVQWVVDRFYPEGYQRLFAEVATVPPGADGLICLPYFTGERCPSWDPTARATFHGLTIEHGRAAIARAVLEGVAFCLKDVWQVLAENGPLPGLARLTGSIARSSVWTQILADVLGVTLLVGEAADASAIGAAQIAARAVGAFGKKGITSGKPEAAKVIEPDAKRSARYMEVYGRFRELQHRSRGE